jgi:2,3-bisphosphoglycerate-dependent phosphoglycerate mutase
LTMYRITFLRHGRSLADDEDRYEARYDSPLTDVGEQQARKLAEVWRDDAQRKYDLIISSSLKRAGKTAEILSDVLSVPVSLSDDWMEIDAGELSGMSKAEELKFPMKPFQGPFDRIADGSGESETQIHARALTAIENLINLGEGNYLVVSHGAFLNAAVRMAFGIPVPVNRNGVMFRFTDTGYMDLGYNRNVHRWFVYGFHTG